MAQTGLYSRTPSVRKTTLFAAEAVLTLHTSTLTMGTEPSSEKSLSVRARNKEKMENIRIEEKKTAKKEKEKRKGDKEVEELKREREYE
jgi:hypothetical protein